MRDQIYDRDLRFARSRLSSDFVLLAQAIASAFKVLTRIHFEAPWREDAHGPCDA